MSINYYPADWRGTIGIDFTTDEWGYILNGLHGLIEYAYLWGWATTEVETDIRNIFDRIEKNIGLE